MVAWFQKFVAWWKAKPWIQVQKWASSFIMRFWTKQVQSYLLENLFLGSILHFQRGVCTRILRRWLWVPAHSVVTLGLTPFDTNVATWPRQYDTWKWLGLPSTTINMQWLKYISFFRWSSHGILYEWCEDFVSRVFMVDNFARHLRWE